MQRAIVFLRSHLTQEKHEKSSRIWQYNEHNLTVPQGQRVDTLSQETNPGEHKRKKKVLIDKEVALAFWPEVLEEWLALTCVNYQRNVYVSMLLDPN